MEVKLNALCVRTVDYKDNDKLITLCTIEKGKILAKATGCKKSNAKLRYAASPLCFGEYILVENNGRYIIKGCECFNNFADIAKDLHRYYAGFGILECIDKLSKEGETETCRNLTLLAVNSLKDLAYTETETNLILLEFLKSVLQVVGYKLNFDTCAVSGKPLKNNRICFDFTYSGIVLFENRSTDYIELKPAVIDVLTDETIADKALASDIAKILTIILQRTAFVTKFYAIDEYFNL